MRALKTDAQRDLSVGGAELAGVALAAGPADEVNLLLHPIAIGGGKPALPVAVQLDLELLDQRRFASGVVHLRSARAPERSGRLARLKYFCGTFAPLWGPKSSAVDLEWWLGLACLAIGRSPATDAGFGDPFYAG